MQQVMNQFAFNVARMVGPVFAAMFVLALVVGLLGGFVRNGFGRSVIANGAFLVWLGWSVNYLVHWKAV
jgi:hypothetical protein